MDSCFDVVVDLRALNALFLSFRSVSRSQYINDLFLFVELEINGKWLYDQNTLMIGSRFTAGNRIDGKKLINMGHCACNLARVASTLHHPKNDVCNIAIDRLMVPDHPKWADHCD